MSRVLGRILVASVAIAVSHAAAAEDEAFHAAQRQAANVVTIAKTAPLLGPGMEVDEEAVRALMEHTQITDRDIMDPERFGIDDEALARSFAQSVKDEPDFCRKVFVYIGDGVHLLRRAIGGLH